MDNNKNLNNVEYTSIEPKQPSTSEQEEQIIVEKANYKYLKELNEKLTVFIKNNQKLINNKTKNK